MSSWISEHRLRSLAVLAVVVVGAALGSALQPGAARMGAFLVAVGIAAGLGWFGGTRSGPRRATVGEERDQAADRRDRAAERRDRAAANRDQAGEHRDRAGDNRDEAADQRDRDADLRDRDRDQDQDQRESDHPADAGAAAGERDRPELDRGDAAAARTRASHDRGAGAVERTSAELDRDAALADRGAAAGERAHAELDRDAALADRGVSARERELASMDDLTGVYLRAVGFAELKRELARARRTEQPLALAFIDVDHLKTANDSRGHAAGDRMLREVAQTLKSSLRPYDLIFRYGGDEFVCALPGMDQPDATKRLAVINTTLASTAEHGSVTLGLAALQPGDSAEDLVARADAALLRERERQRGART